MTTIVAQHQLTVRGRRNERRRRCASSARRSGSSARSLADENFGTGTTGKKLNEMITQVGEVLETHRDAIKAIVAQRQHRPDHDGRSSA